MLRTTAAVLGLGFGLGLSGLPGLPGGARPAHANPASIVPSAADPGDPADFNIRVDYEAQISTAAIFREAVGDAVDPLDPIPKHRDLAFREFRHVLVPRADLGIYHNTWISAALPIVIASQRELNLGEGVTRDTSLTLQEGLVPAQGFDARDPGTALPGDGVLRSPSRSGLDQIHLGLGIALMNQEKDPTKPTWKLGAEYRLPVGKVMRFNPEDPDSETGVGSGVHEVRVWTSFARRYRRTEAWFELHWQAPVAVKETSLYFVPSDEKFGATNIMPGQQGGVAFGLELYAVDDAANQNRISLDLGARVDAHFEGRGYSEIWELLAYAGNASLGGPLVLDANPTVPERQARSHPGISNIENYLEMSGRAAIRAQLGKYVRFAALFDLIWKTDHAITFADAGVDLPTCGPGVSSRCEDEENSVVNPESNEVNPLHSRRVDLVGHRYHAEDSFGFVIGVQGQILF